MAKKVELLYNLDKIHTTDLGAVRIKKNLCLATNDVVKYCISKILDKNCFIYQEGKNWYCEMDSIKITINASSYTIITAHKVNHNKSKKIEQKLSIRKEKCPKNHRCKAVPICPVNALSQKEKEAPEVDETKCIACGKCMALCPKKVFVIEKINC